MKSISMIFARDIQRTAFPRVARAGVALVVSVAFLFFVSPLFAQPSGSNAAWEKQVRIKFSGSELRDAVRRFAESQKVGFFLDRRVDPNQPLEFESSNCSVEETFFRLAESLDLGFCRIGSVGYLGPKEAALKLQKLLPIQQERCSQLPPRLGRLFSEPVDWNIRRLETPRDILQKFAEERSLRWTNLDRLPHDLWPETQLERLSFGELITLVLIGFDLTYAFSSERMQLTIIEFPENWDAALPSAAGGPATRSEPGRKEGKTTNKDIPLSRKRFTIQVKEQSASDLLSTFAERLDLKLEIDENSLKKKGISLETKVSFDLQEATANELFRAVLQPIDCKFVLKGKTLEVSAK